MTSPASDNPAPDTPAPDQTVLAKHVRDKPEPLSAARALARWIEMIALFFGLPALIAAFMDPAERLRNIFAAQGVEHLFDTGRVAARAVLAILLVAAAVIAVVLARDPTFDNRRLWNWAAFKKDLPRILGLFALGALVMLAAAWALDTFTGIMTITGRDGEQTSAFLRLPREAPIILVFIAIGYPWLSAYPQEITHRAFFFHRYAPLFPNTASLFVVNVLAFAWMHVPFWSVEALLLTLPGGALFAWTYLRTGSTLAAGMEHALYGFWAFLVGLGWFVFTGSVGN